MNLGCGPDTKEGWVNVDKVVGDNIVFWDMIENGVPENWKDHFDFILINHVFCTMPYAEVRQVLYKVYSMLKPGGKLQVIDMDVQKAIADFIDTGGKNLPIQEGSSEWNLCMHLSGYSTRPSLYTAHVMGQFLFATGFTDVVAKAESEYDLRPLESCVVEAVK